MCYTYFMLIAMAVVCGLLSMISYGLANVFSQPLARKLGTVQMLFLRGIAVTLILAVGALIDYRDFNHYKAILLTFGLGIAGYLPVLAFTHGIKISRIGIMAPIAGASPLITVLLSFFFLHTPIHFLQWLAIVVIIAANVVMSVDLKDWRSSTLTQLSSGIPFAIIAALGWGCFYFFLVYSTRSLGPWLSAFLVEAGVTFAAGIHLLFPAKRIPFKEAVSKSVLANSILVCFGTVAYTIGVLYYNVSIVAVLSDSTAIVSVLLAVYLFHEHLTSKEKVAAIVIVASTVVITLFR
ncbi:MAG TPA: DMT family transporter [Ktedonobacteraceae bacterium]